MCEEPSQTANHQRLNEMLVHLTPIGARVPYGICLDAEKNIWVASKGGLFKFSPNGKKLTWSEKSLTPKHTSPFCQVLYHDGKIIAAFSDEHSAMTILKIMDSSGNLMTEQFIDGRVRSLVINEDGEMFLTKRMQSGESIIYSTKIEYPLEWEEIISEDDMEFQTLCAFSSSLLIVSTCSSPVNMYSKQAIRLIDLEKRKIVGKFGDKGKINGEVFFPLCMKRYNDDLLILDKTGRIQQFKSDGQFIRIAAEMDAYLCNAFAIDDDKALLACSGIVLDNDNKTICDDWLETINLDGSRWIPDQRDAL